MKSNGWRTYSPNTSCRSAWGTRGTSKARGSETYLDETAYFSGDLTTTTIVRAPLPDGVALPASRLVIFGARDLFDDSEVGGEQPAAPEVQDRGLRVADFP